MVNIDDRFHANVNLHHCREGRHWTKVFYTYDCGDLDCGDEWYSEEHFCWTKTSCGFGGYPTMFGAIAALDPFQ